MKRRLSTHFRLYCSWTYDSVSMPMLRMCMKPRLTISLLSRTALMHGRHHGSRQLLLVAF